MGDSKQSQTKSEHLSTQLSYTPSLQNTQNNMFLFRKSAEPVDEPVNSVEPKRFSRKELEEQVASLTEQLSTAEAEKERALSAATKCAVAQRKTADENAQLNGKVFTFRNTCNGLQEELRKNQVKLTELENSYEQVKSDVCELEDVNGVLTDQLNKLKNDHEAIRAVASENTELWEKRTELEKKCNALVAKLKKFENLAEEVNEVHKANQRLEEENKRIKSENERIESEMKALKQATEDKIADCESARLADKIAYNRLLARPKIVEKALFNAAKECVGILKKRKLGNTVGEQSFAGASLPIADVVSCHGEQPSSD